MDQNVVKLNHGFGWQVFEFCTVISIIIYLLKEVTVAGKYSNSYRDEINKYKSMNL